MGKILEIFSISFLSTISVVLVHAVIAFYFLITDIDAPTYYSYAEAQEELVEVMTEDDLKIPDETHETEALDQDVNPEDITALSSDVNDSRETSDNDYSQYIPSDASKSAEESVQDMIDDIKKDLDSQNKDYDLGLGEEKDYDFNKPKDDDNSGGDGKTKKAAKTMADYDFSSPSRSTRNKRGLKIPGYTGKGSGVIYVKVTIDPIGYVVGTPTIDYSKTTMKEPYALQQAIAYAKKERFDRDPKAPKKQQGYFIYTYVAQ